MLIWHNFMKVISNYQYCKNVIIMRTIYVIITSESRSAYNTHELINLPVSHKCQMRLEFSMKVS